MPLQIRRGTTAERLSITPLVGELVFDTTLSQIFVGNGTTAGGTSPNIDTETIEQALDTVGAALVNGTHQNISFTYGTVQDTANRIDATVSVSDLLENLDLNGFDIVGNGNISITGQIIGDVTGSIFADNSTMLIDGTNGRIVGPVFANVTGNVLGNLAGNVIGNLTGDVTGSVFGDDSVILIDGTNSTINLEETFDGSILPSVDNQSDLGSLSKRIKDVYTNGTIFANNISSEASNLYISSDSGIVTIGDPADFKGSLNVISNLYQGTVSPLNISQHFSNPAVNGLYFLRTRGTTESRSPVQINDQLGKIVFQGQYGATNATWFGASITAVVTGAPSGIHIPTKLSLSTDDGVAQQTVEITENGEILTNAVNITKFLKLPVYADDTARLTAIPTPVKGMVIMMESGTTPAATNEIQFFNGTSWVNL
jgi:Major tropism determinant N-terminal domain